MFNRTMYTLITLGWLLGTGCDDSSTSISDPGSLELIRDTWGVPHIYADTAEGAMYGFGWAQAEDHLQLMSVFYLESTGQLSATFSSDIPFTQAVETAADFLRSDRTVRLFRLYDDPAQMWARIDEQDPPGWTDFSSSSLITAFTAGINDFRHPDLVIITY